MAMRRYSGERQEEFWIATAEVARSPGHPFYVRSNEILKEKGFDRFVEEDCSKFSAEGKRRPGARACRNWYRDRPKKG